MADTETANAAPTTLEEATQGAKSFLAQAQEAIGDAVDATVAAVKEHPIAAAGIAAGVAAAVGGAAYAATQLGGDKEPAPDDAKK
ncbi:MULTISPECIES: hypothetical protein [unclassified Sphingomonas]|jgi:ElaB/YqjD/DUF883 family membrane-anchored ribosome-binding protein|uniref:hypothetical protein n=1 Tax=unclassified Sphingomonas TaxID=196159 RepID=UPI000AE736B1|nr:MULTISPECIES: hypothetical protein [unclassified Sphingomonas]